MSVPCGVIVQRETIRGRAPPATTLLSSTMSVFLKIFENVQDVRKMNALFPARGLCHALGWSTMTLHVRGAADIRFRLAGSDINVLRQVFVKKSYELTKYPQYPDILDAYRKILASGKVPVFVDGGANIGASAIWFARMFPDALVLAVEPDPGNAALCRHNCAPFEKIRVVEAALGSTSGAADIIDPAAESWSMQVRRASAGSIRIVSVPDLIASVENGCAFGVKVDIEGFEQELFSENTDWLDDISLLTVEPHDWMRGLEGTSITMQKAVADQEFDMLISDDNLIYVRRQRRAA